MSSDSSREVDFHFDLNRHLTVTNGNASYPVPAAGMLLCSVGRMQNLSGSVSLLLVHDLFFYITTFLSLNDRILTPRLQKLRNQPFFSPYTILARLCNVYVSQLMYGLLTSVRVLRCICLIAKPALAAQAAGKTKMKKKNDDHLLFVDLFQKE